MARGRILAFSIDLLRRRYNTLALLCECVTEAEETNKINALSTVCVTVFTLNFILKYG